MLPLMTRYEIDETCVGCDMCRPACPLGAILPGTHLFGCGRDTCRGCPAVEECENQIPAIRGAYLIDESRCDGCGQCVMACPLGLIVVAEDDREATG